MTDHSSLSSLQEKFFSHVTALIRDIDEPAIVLAVSGGSDSMALLHLMHAFQKMHAPHLFLSVATVDHGLRLESQNEAQDVARTCHALGLPHSILMWEDEKPKSRLQERARDARYALLHDFCRKHHANILMTAHHYDDQVETFFMRLFKGSSTFGLMGIRSKEVLSDYHFSANAHDSRASPPLYVLRPFLKYSKKELIDYLNKHHFSFTDDPSNGYDKFTRVKWRHLLKKIEEMNIDVSILKKTFAHIAEEQSFLLKIIERERSLCLKKGKNTSCWLFDARHFLSLEPFLQKRVLRQNVTQLSGKRYPPKFTHILLWIEKIKQNNSFTCGGYYWRFNKVLQSYDLQQENPRQYKNHVGSSIFTETDRNS